MALEEIFQRQFAELDRSLVQDQVIAALQADPEAFIRAYRQHADSFGGRYVSTDLAKELFAQYAASRENRGRYNAAVHNAAAVLASEQFRRAIEDVSDPARIGAIFLTGMPGAGKTTALQTQSTVLGAERFAPRQRVIFEGQMVNPVTSIEKVGQALQAGLQVSLMAILPKPEDALANTFRRFQELGRGATIDVMAQIQEGLPAGLRALSKEFGDRLNIEVLDVRVRSIPERLEGERGIVVIEKELENGSVRDRLIATAERLRESGAIDDDCYQQCLGQAPYGRQFGLSAGHGDGLEASTRGRGLPEGSRQAHQLEPPAHLEADQSRLSGLEILTQSFWRLDEAAALDDTQSALKTGLVEAIKGDLRAALERPGTLAAFADSFSHPGLVAIRLEEPSPENLDQALYELYRVRPALVDQGTAAEMREALDGLQRMDGPTPWDTFFASPGDPDKALMPLFGCCTADVLGLGPIEGGGQHRSEGGQALFYPVGGYERFEQATSVVVTQTLADGLAIDAALQGDPALAVVVASTPEGVLQVCRAINQELVNRAAVAAPGEKGSPSVIAALAHPSGAGSEAEKRLALEGPQMGTAIIRPRAAGHDDEAMWSRMPPGDVAELLRAGGDSSRLRLEGAASRRDERLDHGDGFRESIRELRASTREPTPSGPTDAPAKTEKRTHSVSRRL